MAGVGPAPAEKRRRTNQPARGDWVDLEPLKEAVLEDLPADRVWSVEAREMWDAWQRDPVTAQWSPADVAFAKQTIRLIDNPKAKPGEVRLRLTELGLTPEGKKKLRWRVGQDVAPARHGAPRKTQKQRARLSVVK